MQSVKEDSFFVQVSCGTSHTLALVPSRGKLYSFGHGDSGQLGRGEGSTANATLPQSVAGPWAGAPGDTNKDQVGLSVCVEYLL